MKRNETPKKASPKSSHSMLLDCMVAHMARFGYELEDMDKYLGRSSFRHYDGTAIGFKTARELIQFVREASHRKRY